MFKIVGSTDQYPKCISASEMRPFSCLYTFEATRVLITDWQMYHMSVQGIDCSAWHQVYTQVGLLGKTRKLGSTLRADKTSGGDWALGEAYKVWAMAGKPVDCTIEYR